MSSSDSSVRHAVSFVIYHPEDSDDRPQSARRFVIVQRPESDKELPNVWGLPAGMHYPSSSAADEDPESAAKSWKRSVFASGVKKLGVELTVGRQLGEEQHLDRGEYRLVMRQFEASISPLQTLICPQPAHPDVTQYQQWKYGTAADISEAAEKGSLCSRMYLAHIRRNDPICHMADGRPPNVKIDHAVLIPGNGCGKDLSDCMWYPWMARKLTESGVSIDLRGFPDHLYAHEDIWKKFVVEKLQLTPATIVIGHSSGAACALRLMEEHNFAACVLVSAYDTDLGDDLERESGYFTRPFNYALMKSNVRKIVQFHSTSDHLVPVAVARRVSNGLRPEAEYIETEDDYHFQDCEYEELMWPRIKAFLE
jgi:predicted alpha/beta hydrolase family esterase